MKFLAKTHHDTSLTCANFKEVLGTNLTLGVFLKLLV